MRAQAGGESEVGFSGHFLGVGVRAAVGDAGDSSEAGDGSGGVQDNLVEIECMGCGHSDAGIKHIEDESRPTSTSSVFFDLVCVQIVCHVSARNHGNEEPEAGHGVVVIFEPFVHLCSKRSDANRRTIKINRDVCCCL